MSFGITKTIPAREGQAGVDSLYDGSLSEFEFHMAGKPSKLNVGDYVYTIFNDMLIGRCPIKELIGGAVNPDSGKPRLAATHQHHRHFCHAGICRRFCTTGRGGGGQLRYAARPAGHS